MPSESITVVRADGTEEVIDVTTTTFSVKIDDQLYSPVVTSEVEIEHTGETSEISDQCGNTRRRAEADKGYALQVTGIVTSVRRANNLTLQMLRDEIGGAQQVRVRSDVIDGPFTNPKPTITQTSELVSYNGVQTDGDEQAFDFTLQAGEENSD